MLPFLAVLTGCIVGVAAACLQVLALHDSARTTARLASVSADPAGTAESWVRDHLHGVEVHTVSGAGTVTVVLTRRLTLPVPLLGHITLRTPLGASVVMALEPPA